jgi:hypothetical protein
LLPFSGATDELLQSGVRAPAVPAVNFRSFNDENAPERYLAPVGFPYGAAHESEVQYLFSLRNAPFPGVLTPPGGAWQRP